jgi:hypothetical protein
VNKLARNLLYALTILLFPGCTPHPVGTIAPILTNTATSIALPPTETLTPNLQPPFQVITSPNGKFVAQLRNFGSISPSIIDVLDDQNSVLWQIPCQGDVPASLPHPELTIYSWSKDSAFLYFYYIFSPDGGDRAFYWTGLDLQSIRVSDGSIRRVIDGKGFVSFAFSEDETQLAYTRDQDRPRVFYVRDVASGTEKKVQVGDASSRYLLIGNIHWTADGKRLAFQTQTADYMVQTIYLDVARMNQKVIQEYKLEDIWFEGWTPEGNLRFFENGKIVAVDPKSGRTLAIGTPTPNP